MASHFHPISHFFFLLIIFSSEIRTLESAGVFKIINNCKETIWPAVFPGENFDGGGFALTRGKAMEFKAPVGWSGRIWGRTGCNFDETGNGECETGACGTSLKCKGLGKSPVSIAEFALADIDFYDVSVMDGFNLPVVIMAINSTGKCGVAGCDWDLRGNCPPLLAEKSNDKVVGCRSACDVFDKDEYCCRGAYGNPVMCRPTFYSEKFKDACPTAYTYVYDDPIFTCSAAGYVVTFCSNRLPMCTYQNHGLLCSGSNSFKSFIRDWWALIAVFSLVTCSCVNF